MTLKSLLGHVTFMAILREKKPSPLIKRFSNFVPVEKAWTQNWCTE